MKLWQHAPCATNLLIASSSAHGMVITRTWHRTNPADESHGPPETPPEVPPEVAPKCPAPT